MISILKSIWHCSNYVEQVAIITIVIVIGSLGVVAGVTYLIEVLNINFGELIISWLA